MESNLPLQQHSIDQSNSKEAPESTPVAQVTPQQIDNHIQHIAQMNVGKSTIELPNHPPHTTLQIHNDHGGASKAAKWLMQTASIGDYNAKKINKDLRASLQHPENIPVKEGLSNEKVFPWTCRTMVVESGSGESKRELEAMFFSSTSDKLFNDPATNQTILLCSGSHISCENYVLPMVQSLTEMGHDVMIFNYAGFGKSKGTRTEKHIYEDTQAAFDKMCEKVRERSSDPNIESRVKVMGYSLGGAAAAQLGTARNVDVVLERTFTKMSSVVNTFMKDRTHLPKALRKVSRKKYEKSNIFNTIDRLEHLTGRCLIVNGTKDTNMPKGTDKEFKQRIHNIGADDQFHMLEVESKHAHDPMGQSIFDSLPEALIGKTERPKDDEDLWFGLSDAHTESREKLDNWLRNKPLEDQAA